MLELMWGPANRERFTRSETVDLQRGEAEWAGGNLYFDQWDYDFVATPQS